MQPISRNLGYKEKDQLILTNSSTTTPEIPYDEFAGGLIGIPAASAITLLTYYCTMRKDKDPNALTPAQNAQPTAAIYQLADFSNTAITQAVTAGFCYPIPPAAFGAATLRIVITGAASAAVEISKKT